MSQVNLSAFDASEGFSRGVSKWKETCWYLLKVFFFLSAIPYPSKFKCFLLSLFGAKVGRGIVIKPRVNIHMPWRLSIGDNCWIGEEVFILNLEYVSVGKNVCISQRAFICTGNHDFKKYNMPYRNRPIVINDGAWIGATCFVGPGVQIGQDVVLVAGSIATNDLDQGYVYRGAPAARIKERWAGN